MPEVDLMTRQPTHAAQVGMAVATFGRANVLAWKAKGKLVNPVETTTPGFDAVVAFVKASPGCMVPFAKVFGKNSELIDNVAKAIVAFLGTSGGEFPTQKAPRLT